MYKIYRISSIKIGNFLVLLFCKIKRRCKATLYRELHWNRCQVLVINTCRLSLWIPVRISCSHICINSETTYRAVLCANVSCVSISQSRYTNKAQISNAELKKEEVLRCCENNFLYIRECYVTDPWCFTIFFYLNQIITNRNVINSKIYLMSDIFMWF